MEYTFHNNTGSCKTKNVGHNTNDLTPKNITQWCLTPHIIKLWVFNNQVKPQSSKEQTSQTNLLQTKNKYNFSYLPQTLHY